MFLALSGWSIYMQVKSQPWGSLAGTLTLLAGGLTYAVLEWRKGAVAAAAEPLSTAPITD